MSRPFIHLHVHTEYSLLDGAAPLDKLISKVVQSGAPAIAITDHGNMYGAIKMYNGCKASGIKPIIGCEFYTSEDMSVKESKVGEERIKINHLVLLAKNNIGYKNISKLCSLAWIEGFYRKPRIDLQLLQQYSEGIICLSACIAGAIPQLLLKNDYEGAKNYAIRLRDMFAEGDFYIELQNHGLDEQKQTNPLLVKIAREIGVKCVATNDVHYIEKDDAAMQDVLLCIQTGSYYDTPDRMKFPCDEFYLKTADEMAEVLGWCPEALDTPYEIMDKCDVSFVFNQYQLPHYICPDNLEPCDYLRQLAYEGLKNRYGEAVPEEYTKRANDELEVIISMGFSEYYLIVWDFINWAKLHDIPVGAGRGSGVGSIIAYAIAITNIDPMKYDLIFERFLNVNRTSMPDFDIDFCYNRRYEVIQYVKDKYGADHISQIITFGRMKRKQAIKDVARVFKIPFAEVTKATSHIAGNYGDDDKKVHIANLINPEDKNCVGELVELYQNSQEWKLALDLAIKLENMPRNTGMHAAGIVIYKNPAIDTVPLAKNGDEITTQFDMIEVEKLGLLKMDFLALMTLTDVKMAHDYVLKRSGVDVNFDELGYDDPNVYELIGTGNTDAVFQLEGGGMKKFMAKFRPRNLEDVIAGISLYRPGPMSNIDLFLDNRRNPDKVRYKHPLLRPILEVTNGIMIYQEQAMTITRVLAGYDMTRADGFRAIISKKKKHLIPQEKEVFIHGLMADDGTVKIKGCVKNGVPEEVGISVFEEMESFASYAFNKSHAAAYAALSYETAFYKRYYPVEFLAAVLNDRIGKAPETAKYMQVLKNDGIALLQPDINKSESLFSPDGGAIRYGLSCVKNVGKSSIEKIIDERDKNGAFKDLYNFIERCAGNSLNKRMLESLIKGGAFDCFGMTRATLMTNYEPILNKINDKKRQVDSNQLDMFGMLGEVEGDYKYDIIREYNAREKLLQEKDVLGMYVTGHPLAGYEKDFAGFTFTTAMLPKIADDDSEDDGEGETTERLTYTEEENPYGLYDGMDVYTGGLLSEVTLKRTKDGKEMAICMLEDMSDRIEVIAFSRTLISCKKDLVKDSLVRIRGKLSLSGKETKITLQELRAWELAEKEQKEEETAADARILYINIAFDDEERLNRINNILSAYSGKNLVRMQRHGKLYQHSATVGNLAALAKELAGIVGAQNIKII